MEWNYKYYYKNFDMTGIIDLPNDSKVMVCDLIDNMPDFMKQADVLFVDPPCSQGNITSFYTKSDIMNTRNITLFYDSLFTRVKEIEPKHLFIEVFASNYDTFLERSSALFSNINVYDSYYYKNKKNKCWIFHCSNEQIDLCPEIMNIDEENVIKYICSNFAYECIGDLCMGTGLVGKYAFNNGRKFVGTELNKKRLAILLQHINQNK